MNARKAFKTLHRRARSVARFFEHWQITHDASRVVNRALDELVMDLEHDYTQYLDPRAQHITREGEALPSANAFDAVLWAWHWRFGVKEEGLSLWMSERRIGFELREDGSRRWFEPPRLPG